MAINVSPSVHAVFIHSTDLVRSASWYCKLLEVPFDAKQVKDPVFNVPVSGDTYLTLDSHASDTKYRFYPGSGPVFNLFSTDLKATFDWIVSEGFTVARKIEVSGNFGWFHLQDPDKNIVMICGNIV